MKVGHEKPINSTAARVMQRGEHHEFSIKSGSPEYENPPVMYPTGLKGFSNGRITIWGSLEETNDRKLVCRCMCGRWVMRTRKAMLRDKEEEVDMCSQCYALAKAKRNEYHRRTGVWKDTEDFY